MQEKDDDDDNAWSDGDEGDKKAHAHTLPPIDRRRRGEKTGRNKSQKEKSEKHEDPPYPYSSSFPSLLKNLGPSATGQPSPRREEEDPAEKDKKSMTSDKDKKKKAADEKPRSFGEEMRRRNESQWMRIENVVRDKMEFYDAYVINMNDRINRQRQENNKRSMELVDKLRQEDEQQMRDRRYNSYHSKGWRHYYSIKKRKRQPKKEEPAEAHGGMESSDVPPASTQQATTVH